MKYSDALRISEKKKIKTNRRALQSGLKMTQSVQTKKLAAKTHDNLNVT